MKTDERNEYVKYLVREKLERAKKLTISHFDKLERRDEIESTLTKLIHTSSNGFRGVVLTSLVGVMLDKNFNPLENFYGCNPRSIFEQGIWYALNEYEVPCGKSDPLNVAKNIQKLDESWAKGRRPQIAAMAAVEFLRMYINEHQNAVRQLLEDFFFYKLIEYAKNIQQIQIGKIDTCTISRQLIAEKITHFILEAPESGATPQLIISHILQKIFSNSAFTVVGGGESVFATNTTSKKPADIWIEHNGNIKMLFEVTVKKIDYKRLDDCLDANRKLGIADIPTTFICRIPEDISELETIEINTLSYKQTFVT